MLPGSNGTAPEVPTAPPGLQPSLGNVQRSKRSAFIPTVWAKRLASLGKSRTDGQGLQPVSGACRIGRSEYDRCGDSHPHHRSGYLVHAGALL